MQAFAPNVGQIIVGAFARIQVRATEITSGHMADARREANLLQVQWGNRGPNLWTVNAQTLPLVQGQALYQVPSDTIDVLDSYLSLGSGTDAGEDASPDATGAAGAAIYDRVLTSLGRSEYLQLPYKQTIGQPTSFWFQKGETPSVTFWPVPDQAYSFYFWRLRQIQDANPANAGMADVPYLWVDAFTAGLAHRLARIYALPLEQARKADAAEAWTIAAEQDIESVPFFISPDVGAYYR